MLFSRLRRVALAVTSALVSTSLAASPSHDAIEPRASALSGPGQSTFVSPGGQVSFGFTVPPREAGSDVYFTIRVPVGVSWGAVGLGSLVMEKSLILLIYLNEAGNNVTFSPRYGQGHYEPPWLDEVDYDVLDGTGIFYQGNTQYMIFRARCKKGCRSWHNGFLDVSSKEVEAIYAYGPSVNLQSNEKDAPLQYHVEHGQFSMDMKRTTGASDAPVVDENSVNDGVDHTEEVWETGLMDRKPLAHGIVMILGTTLFLPLGVAALFKLGFASHAVTQFVGMLFMLAGFGVGIAVSFWYQRSRKFTDKHQIIGFIVMAGLLAQPVLGYLHHRDFMRTNNKGRLAMAHRWIGRIVMIFGIINGFFGFELAQNLMGGRIYSALVIASGLFILGSRIFLEMRKRQWQKRNGGNPAAAAHQPAWRQGGSPGDYNDSPASGSQTTGIGLMPVSSPRDVESKGFGLSIGRTDAPRNRMDLGPMQQPREFA